MEISDFCKKLNFTYRIGEGINPSFEGIQSGLHIYLFTLYQLHKPASLVYWLHIRVFARRAYCVGGSLKIMCVRPCVCVCVRRVYVCNHQK